MTPYTLSVNYWIFIKKLWNAPVLHLVPQGFHDPYNAVTTLRKLGVYVV